MQWGWCTWDHHVQNDGKNKTRECFCCARTLNLQNMASSATGWKQQVIHQLMPSHQSSPSNTLFSPEHKINSLLMKFYTQIQAVMQSASSQNQQRANSSSNDAWKVVGCLSLTRKGTGSASPCTGHLVPLTSPCTELPTPPQSKHGRKDGKATGPWGAAPAPQAPAGPCPCPTGWHPELAPSSTIQESQNTCCQQGFPAAVRMQMPPGLDYFINT